MTTYVFGTVHQPIVGDKGGHIERQVALVVRAPEAQLVPDLPCTCELTILLPVTCTPYFEDPARTQTPTPKGKHTDPPASMRSMG